MKKMRRLLLLLLFIPFTLTSCDSVSGIIECEKVSVGGETYSYGKNVYKVYEFVSDEKYCIYASAAPMYQNSSYYSTSTIDYCKIRVYHNSIDGVYYDYSYSKYVGNIIGEKKVFYDTNKRMLTIETKFSECTGVTYEPIGVYDASAVPATTTTTTVGYSTAPTTTRTTTTRTSTTTSTTSLVSNNTAYKKAQIGYYLLNNYDSYSSRDTITIYNDEVENSLVRTEYIDIGSFTPVEFIKKK